MIAAVAISVSPAYRIEADLDAVFAPELPGLDRDEIRRCGYNWLGGDKVYNPFDVLLLFDTREFGAYWFETGTPIFLIETLIRRGVATLDLDGMAATSALLSAFDVDRMSTEALLFQTGYLTVRNVEERHGRTRYRLGYPNHEVRQNLNEQLLDALLPEASRRLADDAPLRDLLAENDFEGLETLFRNVYASIPYQWLMNNEIARYEGYYASVFYSCFAAQGLDVVAEESGSRGRADMAVRFDGRIYLFEDGRQGVGGDRHGAVEGQELRGQVRRAADPPDRGRVQPRGPQHRRVRGRARLTGAARLPAPNTCSGPGAVRSREWSARLRRLRSADVGDASIALRFCRPGREGHRPYASVRRGAPKRKTSCRRAACAIMTA